VQRIYIYIWSDLVPVTESGRIRGGCYCFFFVFRRQTLGGGLKRLPARALLLLDPWEKFKRKRRCASWRGARRRNTRDGDVNMTPFTFCHLPGRITKCRDRKKRKRNTENANTQNQLSFCQQCRASPILIILSYRMYKLLTENLWGV